MTETDRRAQLEGAGWNVLNLNTDEVETDLMSDVPHRPHARYRLADGLAADGSQEALSERAAAVFGDARYVFFQKGRGAERALAEALFHEGGRVLANGLFRTTALSLTCRGLAVENSPVAEPGTSRMDLDWLDRELDQGDVQAVYLEAANNSLGGWPLAPGDAAEVRERCDRHGVPLVLDLARAITNGLLLASEAGAQHARELAQHAHCVVASLAKEFSVPVGALVGVRDAELQQRIFLHGFEEGSLLEPLTARCSLALALADVAGDISRVSGRAARVAELAASLERAELPVLRPPGGHAVFVEVAEEPAPLRQCFAWMALLYLADGIRGMLMPASRLGGSMLRLALPVDAPLDVPRVAGAVERLFARRDDAPSLAPADVATLHPVYLQRFVRAI